MSTIGRTPAEPGATDRPSARISGRWMHLPVPFYAAEPPIMGPNGSPPAYTRAAGSRDGWKFKSPTGANSRCG
jgi:hypothetical protein